MEKSFSQSLRGKIIALSLVVALIASGAIFIAFDSSTKAETLANERRQDALSAESDIIAIRLREAFAGMSNDLEILATAARLEFNNQAPGIEHEDHSHTKLQELFATLLQTRPKYTQIRLIELDEAGKELVRVNRTANGTETVPKAELQEKGNEPYMSLARRLPAESSALSRVTLNREHGEVDAKETPTVRALFRLSVPDDTVIVINADYRAILRSSFEDHPPKFDTFIVNSAGDTAIFWSNTKTFSFTFAEDTDPEVANFLVAAQQSDDDFEILRQDVLNNLDVPEFATANDFTLDMFMRSRAGDQTHGILQTELSNAVLALLIITVCFALACLFAIRLTAPLRRMKKSLQQLSPEEWSSGDTILQYDRNDELGELAQTFNALLFKLRSDQARLRNIIDNTVDGLIVINSRGMIETFNPACEEIFGYKAEEVLGRNVAILMPDGDRQRHQQYLRDYQETGDAKIIGIGREVRALTKSGEEITIDLSLSEITQQKERSYCGIIRDLTETINTREELRHQKQTLEFALESGDLGLWDWNVLEGRVDYSEQSARMIGLKRSDLKKDFSTWETHTHPKDLMRSSVHMNQFTAGLTDKYKMEVRMRHKSGKWIWVQAKGKIFERDSKGIPTRIVGVHQDITERKRSEMEILEQNRQLALAENVAKMGHWTLRLSTGEVEWSDGIYEMHGLPDPEYRPKDGTITEFCFPDDCEYVERQTKIAIESEEPFEFEFRIQASDQAIRYVRAKGDFFRNENGSNRTMAFGILQDITDAKIVAQMKSEFVSTVNHEIRTPLTSIFGSLDLLKNLSSGQLDDRCERLITLAYDGCGRLNNLVDDILDLEKIESGKIEYLYEVVDFDGLVEHVVQRHEALSVRYDVDFKLQTFTDNVAVNVDQNRFAQALANLMSNAAKFSPTGGQVAIRTDLISEAFVRVSVMDNGPGIPDSFRHRIFEKFAQADGSSKRTASGTGLGLSITKSIIEAFGGQVSFETSATTGTTFHLDIPVAERARKAG